MTDSFKTRTTLAVGSQSYEIHSLPALQGHDLGRLPFSLKILLENLLRFEDGVNVTREDIEALLKWDAKAAPEPRDRVHARARDHAGLHRRAGDRRPRRDARGDDPPRRQPAGDQPARPGRTRHRPLGAGGRATAPPIRCGKNNAIEFGRNGERYSFLRWGQTAFSNFKVVPPNTGIVHQVNVEHLARVVFAEDRNGVKRAFPDTLVGTDSHTTMVNGLGVLGWGVGGIEAEAAMLGQPVTMLIPQVIGFRLKGALPAGRHGHRPRADRHRDAAQEGRRRQVRRVLRRRPRRPAARRPRDDRQHGAGVRQHLRHLPDRRGDDPLPRTHRPPGGADRARRGVRQGAGHVAHQRHARSGLHRRARTRSRHGRTEPRRPEAPAGPRAAAHVEGRLPRERSRRWPRSARRRIPAPPARPPSPPAARRSS